MAAKVPSFLKPLEDWYSNSKDYSINTEDVAGKGYTRVFVKNNKTGQHLAVNVSTYGSGGQAGVGGPIYTLVNPKGTSTKVFSESVEAAYRDKTGDLLFTGTTSAQDMINRISSAFEMADNRKITAQEAFGQIVAGKGTQDYTPRAMRTLPENAGEGARDMAASKIDFIMHSSGQGSGVYPAKEMAIRKGLIEQIIYGGQEKISGLEAPFKSLSPFVFSEKGEVLIKRAGQEVEGQGIWTSQGEKFNKATSMASVQERAMPLMRDAAGYLKPIQPHEITNTNRPLYARGNVLLPGTHETAVGDTGMVAITATPFPGAGPSYIDPNGLYPLHWGRETNNSLPLGASLKELAEGTKKIEIYPGQFNKTHAGGSRAIDVGLYNEEPLSVPGSPSQQEFTGVTLDVPAAWDKITGQPYQGQVTPKNSTEDVARQIQERTGLVVNRIPGLKAPTLNVSGYAMGGESIKGIFAKTGEIPMGIEQGMTFAGKNYNIRKVIGDVKGAEYYMENAALSREQLSGIVKEWGGQEGSAEAARLANWTAGRLEGGKPLSLDLMARQWRGLTANRTQPFTGGGGQMGIDIFQRVFTNRPMDVQEAHARDYNMFEVPNAKFDLSAVSKDTVDFNRQQVEEAFRMQNKEPSQEDVDKFMASRFPVENGKQMMVTGSTFVMPAILTRRIEHPAGARMGADILESVQQRFPQTYGELIQPHTNPVTQGFEDITSYIAWEKTAAAGQLRPDRMPTEMRTVTPAMLDTIKSYLSTARSATTQDKLQMIEHIVGEGRGPLYFPDIKRFGMSPGAISAVTRSERDIEFRGAGESVINQIAGLTDISLQKRAGKGNNLQDNAINQGVVRRFEKIMTSGGEAMARVLGEAVPTGIGGRYQAMLGLKTNQIYLPPDMRRAVLTRMGFKEGDQMNQAMAKWEAEGSQGMGLRYPAMGSEDLVANQMPSLKELREQLGPEVVGNLENNPESAGLLYVHPEMARQGEGDLDLDELAEWFNMKNSGGKLEIGHSEELAAGQLTPQSAEANLQRKFGAGELRTAYSSFPAEMLKFMKGESVSKGLINRNVIMPLRERWLTSMNQLFSKKSATPKEYNYGRTATETARALGFSEDWQNMLKSSSVKGYQGGLDVRLSEKFSMGTPYSYAVASAYSGVDERSGKAYMKLSSSEMYERIRRDYGDVVLPAEANIPHTMNVEEMGNGGLLSQASYLASLAAQSVKLKSGEEVGATAEQYAPLFIRHGQEKELPGLIEELKGSERLAWPGIGMQRLRTKESNELELANYPLLAQAQTVVQEKAVAGFDPFQNKETVAGASQAAEQMVQMLGPTGNKLRAAGLGLLLSKRFKSLGIAAAHEIQEGLRWIGSPLAPLASFARKTLVPFPSQGTPAQPLDMESVLAQPATPGQTVSGPVPAPMAFNQAEYESRLTQTTHEDAAERASAEGTTVQQDAAHSAAQLGAAGNVPVPPDNGAGGNGGGGNTNPPSGVPDNAGEPPEKRKGQGKGQGQGQQQFMRGSYDEWQHRMTSQAKHAAITLGPAWQQIESTYGEVNAATTEMGMDAKLPLTERILRMTPEQRQSFMQQHGEQVQWLGKMSQEQAAGMGALISSNVAGDERAKVTAAIKGTPMGGRALADTDFGSKITDKELKAYQELGASLKLSATEAERYTKVLGEHAKVLTRVNELTEKENSGGLTNAERREKKGLDQQEASLAGQENAFKELAGLREELQPMGSAARANKLNREQLAAMATKQQRAEELEGITAGEEGGGGGGGGLFGKSVGRKLLGGFGLMFMRSIFGLATQGLGYGQAEAEQLEGLTAQGAAGLTGQYVSPFSQPQQIANATALSGVNYNPVNQWKLAQAKSPALQATGGMLGAAAGTLAAAGWMLPEALFTSVGLPLAGIMGATAGIADIYGRSQDPNGLGSRLGMANITSPGAFLKPGGMSPGAFFSNYGNYLKEVPDIYAYAIQDKEGKRQTDQQIATTQGVGKGMEAGLSFNEIAGNVPGANRNDIYAGMGRNILSKNLNMTEQAALSATSFMARHGERNYSPWMQKVIEQAYGSGVDYEALATQMQASWGKSVVGKKGLRTVGGLAESLMVQANAQDLGEAEVSQLQAGTQFAQQNQWVRFAPQLHDQIPQAMMGGLYGTTLGDIYSAQGNAAFTQQASGLNTPIPTTPPVAPANLTPEEYAQWYQRQMSQASAGDWRGNFRNQTALGFQKNAYQYGRDVVGDNIFKALQGEQDMPRFNMFAQAMNMNPMAIANLVKSGQLNLNSLAGTTQTYNGTSISPENLALTDFGLNGQMTGLPWGSTSLNKLGLSGAQVAQQVWGNNPQASGFNPQSIGAMVNGVALPSPMQVNGQTISSVGGQWGLQFQQLANQEAYSNQMYGLQLQGWNQNMAYTQQSWKLQDKMVGLQQNQAAWGFQYQQAQMDLSKSQFYQNNALTAQGMQLDRSFTRQQWGFQDQQRNLQWGWQQEDFGEEARFLTGRQRRLAERQQKRAGTMHELEGDEISASRKHQEDLWTLEDKRFDVQKKQYEESLKLQQENLDKQREFYAEQQKLQAQMRALEREHTMQQMQLQKQEMELSHQYQMSVMQTQKTMMQLQLYTELTSGAVSTLTDNLGLFQQAIANVMTGMGSAPSTSSTVGSGLNQVVLVNPPSTTYTGPTVTHGPNAGGGIVDTVGEDGWEAIVAGQVIPHRQSVSLARMGMLGPQTPKESGHSLIPLGNSQVQQAPQAVNVYIGNEYLGRFVVDTVNKDVRVN